jgi:hypothetical protein
MGAFGRCGGIEDRKDAGYFVQKEADGEKLREI